MAEGGILPWKNNRDNTKYADYSGLQKPLASPPIGYSWIRADDGKWELLDEATGSKVPFVPTEDNNQSQKAQKNCAGESH
mmetsp:Transcript_14951/g.17810  ORF Transcript_14951/g.17810 Transcript_14951/m.17810 type:complete len:80 (-) Transcript_14951:496-735(-)